MKTKFIAGVTTTVALSGTLIFYLGTYGSRIMSPKSYPRIEMNNVQRVEHFSSNYLEARERFLAATSDAGGRIRSFQNPHNGPQGESLYTDVALFGPEDANTILVLNSGTHGVEGYAGSGIQTGTLREGIASRLPPGVGLLMIHAINPYGMAHLRRFNEDNVDLNRNFRNHDSIPEKNRDYEKLADAIAPRSLSFWSEVYSWSRILKYRFTDGMDGVQKAVQGGQYTDPRGLFYGGMFEVWSNTTIRSIAERYLSDANRVVVVDLHTGLGTFGSAEIILNDSVTAPIYQRAVDIWGPEQVRSTVTGESVSTDLDATLKIAFTDMLPNVEVTAVSLEFGTVPRMEVGKALRAENWLHHHGIENDPKANAIKTRLLQAFYPDSEEWKAAVWQRGRGVVERALEWVSRHAAERQNQAVHTP